MGGSLDQLMNIGLVLETENRVEVFLNLIPFSCKDKHKFNLP